MAIFVLWDIAEWSLYYPHSCQRSPVALLWEEATDSPSQDPNYLKSRAQGEKESRSAGKEPGGPGVPAGAGRVKGSHDGDPASCRDGSAGTGSEWL